MMMPDRVCMQATPSITLVFMVAMPRPISRSGKMPRPCVITMVLQGLRKPDPDDLRDRDPQRRPGPQSKHGEDDGDRAGYRPMAMRLRVSKYAVERAV